MGVWTDFLHQQVPSSKKIMPAYYRRALQASECFLALYYLALFFLFPLLNNRWEWVPLVFGVCTVLSFIGIRRMNSIRSVLAFSAIVVAWCGWGIYTFGWSYGLQHLLVILLLFLFFNVYISPRIKILTCLLLLGYRMGLFAYSGSHEAMYTLDQTVGIIFQTINSACFFLLLSVICILFSSSTQDTERQLRLDNENLNREAGTDPLTGLPNRREMINIIEQFLKESPETPFSVAIADIDFFKKVNDTYGHACGDAVLVALTGLFRTEAQGRYRACRWGGEEFCFFLPGKNLDEAGIIMNDLNIKVERTPMEFEGQSISITITVGVEETDFHSSLDDLLKSADSKLYLGKNAGRNRVVV